MLGLTAATMGANASVSSLRQAMVHRQLMLRSCIPPSQVMEVVPVAVMRAAVCGQPGTPPCDVGTPQSALSGLSGSWTNLLPGVTAASAVVCSDFAAAVKRLGIVLAEAKRVGARGAVVDDAAAYFENESSWLPWKRTDPVDTATCAQAVATANGYISALTGVVRQAGGQTVNLPAPVVPKEPGSPGGFADILATVRMVALGGAVIAGVVLLAPVVWEGVSALKLLKKGR